MHQVFVSVVKSILFISITYNTKSVPFFLISMISILLFSLVHAILALFAHMGKLNTFLSSNLVRKLSKVWSDHTLYKQSESALIQAHPGCMAMQYVPRMYGYIWKGNKSNYACYK